MLTSRQSVGDQLGSDLQPIGDRSATGWRLYLGRLFLIAESLQLFGDRSATDRRLVGDQSATKNYVGIVYNDQSRSVANQSATCRRPPKTFLRSIWSQRGFTCSNQNLLAIKSSLQPSATGRRPVADLLATTLQPPCDHQKFWSRRGRRPVASYVGPGLYIVHNIDSLVQDCSISIANPLEILQSCAKPSVSSCMCCYNDSKCYMLTMSFSSRFCYRLLEQY